MFLYTGINMYIYIYTYEYIYVCISNTFFTYQDRHGARLLESLLEIRESNRYLSGSLGIVPSARVPDSPLLTKDRRAWDTGTGTPVQNGSNGLVLFDFFRLLKICTFCWKIWRVEPIFSHIPSISRPLKSLQQLDFLVAQSMLHLWHTHIAAAVFHVCWHPFPPAILNTSARMISEFEWQRVWLPLWVISIAVAASLNNWMKDTTPRAPRGAENVRCSMMSRTSRKAKAENLSALQMPRCLRQWWLCTTSFYWPCHSNLSWDEVSGFPLGLKTLVITTGPFLRLS